jgi:hypothetical protein
MKQFIYPPPWAGLTPGLPILTPHTYQKIPVKSHKSSEWHPHLFHHLHRYLPKVPEVVNRWLGLMKPVYFQRRKKLVYLAKIEKYK